MQNKNPLIVPKGSLVILSGIPGSGKSTLAEEYFDESEILSSDKLRERHFGGAVRFSEDGTPVQTFSSNQDIVIFKIMEEIARARCLEGLTTVIDAMNFTDIARNQFVKLGNWKSVITIVFDPEKAVARNATRARRVSE